MSADTGGGFSVALRRGWHLAAMAAVSCTAAPATAADPGAETVGICYEMNCTHRAQIVLSGSDLAELAGLFRTPAGNAGEERGHIAGAIALLERIAGRQTPTYLDRAGNPDLEVPAAAVTPAQSWPPLANSRRHPDVRGQLDCVDESTNTTAYLGVLQRHGWLRYHRIMAWAFRAPHLLDQHWSAQIEETASGRRYVVDSWVRDNGLPPDVEPVAGWRLKGFDESIHRAAAAAR